MLAGVISDTHGLLRPQAVEALRGADLIIHAGDVGAAEVLRQLRLMAPTFAVRGNVDRDGWADSLPSTEVVDAGGRHLYVLHDIAALDLNPSAARFAAVIYGHSHQPKAEVRDGVLFLNPGSAGPRRFSLPVCVARIRIEDGTLSHEFVDLTPR